MLLTTEEIVGVRERRLRSRMVREYRVKWRDWPTEDATWEREHILQCLGLQLLEDKQSQGRRTVMSPPPRLPYPWGLWPTGSPLSQCIPPMMQFKGEGT